MKTCEYPTCSEKTGLNKWGMCKEHEGKYSAYKSKLGGRSFNLKYVQDGLARMAEEAKNKKHDNPLINNAQEALL